MKALHRIEQLQNNTSKKSKSGRASLKESIEKSWSKIVPFWPLKNIIAVNPIGGFENLLFEDALSEANAYFQQKEIPKQMEQVNRESIKWLQAFFDQGQATIQMPCRNLGLLNSIRSLIRFDNCLGLKDLQKKQWLDNLPKDPEEVVERALWYLGISPIDQELFITLMLTSLPGWASYVQYRSNWTNSQEYENSAFDYRVEYLAFRMVLVCLIWPEAKKLILIHKNYRKKINTKTLYQKITESESSYQREVNKKIASMSMPIKKVTPNAQLVFCIDVRSEPFRRAIEAQGEYETFGYAGFFGVPVSVEDSVTKKAHSSCPVLLSPKHRIIEVPRVPIDLCKRGYKRLTGFIKVYQSLKYTFSTPFTLAEGLGIGAGLWMALKCFMPGGASRLKSGLQSLIAPQYSIFPEIDRIPFEEQISYGLGALKMIGLTENFSPLVVFCGHGSSTQNNAFASSLDCGACGGNHGSSNARIIAAILNSDKVRTALKRQDIRIPDDTLFLAAMHNTTTDQVEIFDDKSQAKAQRDIQYLKMDLEKAKRENSLWRIEKLGVKKSPYKSEQHAIRRAQDWAQIRPEWGLARNAAFIAGPRWLTKNVNFDGRTFLHSYDWENDGDVSSLTTILTAPMIVAQWINAQYLFSTLDNVAFGAGSKVTKNIVGKIGIMQGNASDLMHGLPLQSVNRSDQTPYHDPMRLSTFVYAPVGFVQKIIDEQASLQKLFSNEWVHLFCHDPLENKIFKLQKDLTWSKVH